MKIIITLSPAVLLVWIMYFTNIYTAKELMLILASVSIASTLCLLIILGVNKFDWKK